MAQLPIILLRNYRPLWWWRRGGQHSSSNAWICWHSYSTFHSCKRVKVKLQVCESKAKGIWLGVVPKMPKMLPSGRTQVSRYSLTSCLEMLSTYTQFSDLWWPLRLRPFKWAAFCLKQRAGGGWVSGNGTHLHPLGDKMPEPDEILVAKFWSMRLGQGRRAYILRSVLQQQAQ